MDEMDVFLGRMIKNWTAEFRPPTGGRKRLLRRAVLAAEEPLWQINTDWFRYIRPHQLSVPRGDQLSMPLVHTASWCLQISAFSRLSM